MRDTIWDAFVESEAKKQAEHCDKEILDAFRRDEDSVTIRTRNGYKTYDLNNLQIERPGEPPIKIKPGDSITGYSNEKVPKHTPESPKHYKLFLDSNAKANEIEAIDVIKSALTEEEFKGYLKGNQIKYLLRHNNKHGEEDLRKAKVYMEMYEGKGIHV